MQRADYKLGTEMVASCLSFPPLAGALGGASNLSSVPSRYINPIGATKTKAPPSTFFQTSRLPRPVHVDSIPIATMKPVVATLLLSSVLLFSAFASASASAAFAPVLDTDGNKLKRGAKYYVVPSPGIGRGLTLAGRNNQTCPLFVAKEAAEVAPGLPLAFFPFDGDHVVRVATDANVVFSASTICVQSTVWRLGGPDGPAGERYVGTGGVVGQTGSAARANWFRVEEFEEGGGYKFAFCPQPAVCRNCGKPLCGDLGLFVEGGRTWLGYPGEPFPVAFRKA